MDNPPQKYCSKNELYGHAIKYTYIKEDGTMWVGNNEYETQVNFCPWTGNPAPKQMVLKEEWENGTKYYV